MMNVYLSCISDMYQRVTYRYREFPVPGIFHFFGGIGTGIGKNWYRKKVSEPVSEKIGTGKKSRNRYRKNLVPERYRYREFLFFFWWYRNRYRKKLVPEKKSRNRYRKKLVPEKGLGTGIGKIWYRKKSLGTGIGKIWYQKKSRN